MFAQDLLRLRVLQSRLVRGEMQAEVRVWGLRNAAVLDDLARVRVHRPQAPMGLALVLDEARIDDGAEVARLEAKFCYHLAVELESPIEGFRLIRWRDLMVHIPIHREGQRRVVVGRDWAAPAVLHIMYHASL